MTGSKPQWWEIRRAHNRSGSIYTCPFCGHRIPALMEHVLIIPEGDGSGRRHAHTECAKDARAAGDLPDYAGWKATQPKRPPLWRRMTNRKNP